MIKILRLSSLAAILILFSIISEAQNYQPFRKGPTYHYIAQDSIYSMRIDSAKVVNGDSIFVFNRIARKGGTPATTPCFSRPMGFRYAILPGNQFGNSMIKKANGDYIFKTNNNQEFLLKTKVSVGTSWTVNASLALTASLQAKTLETVTQANPDSVITFLLSNGKTIKLSKNFGLTKTQNLASYTDTYFKPKELDLYAIPEKGIGHTISSPFAIYNFQPGDKFAYYEKYESLNGGTCSEEWTRLEVLSRNNSQLGDTIYYSLKEEKLTTNFGSPSAPWGFCRNQPGTTLHPVKTLTITVTKKMEPATNALAHGFFAPSQSQAFSGLVTTGIFRKAQYNSREQMRFASAPYDSCAKAYSFQLDSGSDVGYAVGLGQVYLAYFSMGDQQIKVMEAYQKGAETYGTWRTLAQILATTKDLEAKPLLKISPNPFSSELTITPGETSGQLQISLMNSLGQNVWQNEVAANGSEFKIKLPELAKGLYIFQASQNGKIFNSRLVKE